MDTDRSHPTTQVPSWTVVTLLAHGVLVRRQARRVVGHLGLALGACVVGVVALGVSALLHADPDAWFVVLFSGLFVFVWLYSGFRIDPTGICPHRLPWVPRRTRYRWDDVERLEVGYSGRMVAIIPHIRRPTSWVDKHPSGMIGTGGMFRHTQPLRILAAAAQLGLLPPDLPVRVRVRPSAPSERHALRELTRAHPNVRVGS